MKQPHLRPHDVSVLLQISLAGGWTYRELAESVGLSVGEVHNSVARLRGARLAGAGFPINRLGAFEFLLHGVPYSFPATFASAIFASGIPVPGIPGSSIPGSGIPGFGVSGVLTAARMLGLDTEKPGDKSVVWPSDQGPDRGMALAPLSPAFVPVAARNPELHRLLAIVDVIRIGKPRETKAARELLRLHFGQ